jgi:dihydrodipicolinate synthase/N-acetylneuraminate lyase
MGEMQLISAALEPDAAVVRRFGQPRTIKAALLQRGLFGARHVRLPYIGLSDTEAAELAEAIAATDSLLGTIAL